MPSIPPMDQKGILVDCNAKLSAQVQVQRKEINALEDKLKELEVEKEEWQETLLCVNRLWEELNTSVAFLDYMTTGADISMSVDDIADDSDNLLEQRNPFLAKLLGTFLSDIDDKDDAAAIRNASDALTDEASDIEAALRKKMAPTLQAATRILENLTKKDGADDAEGKQATSSSSASKELQLLSMVAMLKAQNERAQKLDDRVKLEEISKRLADKADELLVAQRKIIQLSSRESPAKEAKAGKTPADAGPSNAASTVDDAVDKAELEHVTMQLEARTAELDVKEAMLMKTERKIQELKDKLGATSNQVDRQKQQHEARVKSLNKELDNMERKYHSTAAERDRLLRDIREMQFQLDQGGHAMRQLEGATGHIRDLERRLNDLNIALRREEDKVIHMKAKQGSAATVEDLQQGFTAMEKDITRLREAATKYKKQAVAADAAKSQAAEATRKLAQVQAQFDTLRTRLDAARAAIKAHAVQTQAWKQRESELELFVQLSHAALGTSAEEADAQRLQATATSLKQQVEDLTKQLIEAKDNDQVVAELQKKIQELEESNASLTAKAASLEKQVQDLQQELENARSEVDAVMGEMDAIIEDAEQAKEESKRLRETIFARDADNARLATEVAEANRDKVLAEENKQLTENATRQAEANAANLQRLVVDLERQIAALSSDLEKAQAEARAMNTRCDEKSRDAEKYRAERERLEADKKAAQEEALVRQKERDAEADKAGQQANRADRLQREVADFKERLERLRRSGQGGVAEELQAEADALRKMINCNVCHARQKDVVITKCYHLFCNHCVQANLNSRNRKCPGCGIKFGDADVRPFYFT